MTCYYARGPIVGNNNINNANYPILINGLKRLVTIAAVLAWAACANALEIELPPVGLVDVPAEIVVTGAGATEVVTLTVAGESYWATADETGRVTLEAVQLPAMGTETVIATVDGESASAELRVLPGWISLMPAFLAIAVALLVRNVLPALLLGLWIGATALTSFSAMGFLTGLLDTFAVFIAQALANPDQASIVLFGMMIGGMVGIITRNGGMQSVVRLIVSRAKTAIGGQVSVWLMGLMIFFDDYANTLVVGNTARPLTDQLKVSREKLAYIVDSTAAPVVCLALVTTWIGFEVGLIDDAIKEIDALSGMAAYSVFLHSIPYSFYPILAVIFVLAVSVTGKDMGPMYEAEVRARGGQVEPHSEVDLPALEGDKLEPKENIPLRAANAFVPIFTLIIGLAVSIYVTGEGDTLTEIVGSANPYQAMMWASFVGALVAAAMSVGQGILSSHETVDAWYGGARATLFGMIVLVLAWAMSAVTSDLNAKGYLISILGDALPAALVPAIVFILSAITAFATGTSWGTMGILMPLVIPLAWAVMTVSGMADPSGMHILYSAVACVLAGAVWGDHCSPISDTTVLSSIASGCDHIEHVRTQLPYAMLVGIVGISVGTIPGGFGVPPWISIIVGIAILVTVLRVFGKRADDAGA